NQTEEVRVTVDEVGIHLKDLKPYVKYVPQETMFRDARHPDHKERGKKLQAWNEIGDIFGIAGSVTGSATPVANSYMDLLLETEGTWKKGNAFAVTDVRAKVEADGDSNPEFGVTLTSGTLLNNGNSQRWGDCEGPMKLGGSAFIRCYVALQGLEVSYRKGNFFSQITVGKVNARAMANLPDAKAEVEFRHFYGILL
ncbi:hypothetical protein HPB47_010056, partial [Ixodes persulcatus]